MEEAIEEELLGKSVKSKAVVRYASMPVPTKFNRLQCNTNLNLPPLNWLTTAGSYGLHQALYHVPGFTSFHMTNMFPDCVGQVDVVSDAENIKKLLKLPYNSQGVISMFVHKVGNSLLLDEFDIHKYLLRQADDDWKWLKTFILEQLLAYEHGNFALRDKSREAIRSKALLSKFLSYSVLPTLAEPTTENADTNKAHQDEDTRPPKSSDVPILPEPKIEEKVPDPQSLHDFTRNVLWTFEDIRMLVGTDMPIFGGPNRPCISLRLRNMAHPINVLTGIDYWLDNLMCNVPEVLMCYHLDGIVQKYEIIKTEDLPYLEDSRFSPLVVRNMAQNILAFLKAKATKAGHTYWLFKARNDDVVKLYDLTALCEKQETTMNDKSDKEPENPFTVPVGMLLYSVARNMKNTTRRMTPKISGSIKALLDNCLKLLPCELYPQIITSSHYILSDLYIPAGIDPKAPDFLVSENDTSQMFYDDDDDLLDDSLSTPSDSSTDLTDESDFNAENIAVVNISEMSEYNFEKRKQKKRQNIPAPLIATTEERCQQALEHISNGLSCLQYFNSSEENFIRESETRAKEEEKVRIIHEEQNPNMAKPFKPIPLPYTTISKTKEDVAAAGTSQSDLEKPGDGQSASEQPDRKRIQRKVKSGSERIEISSEENELKYNIVPSDLNNQPFGSWTVHLKLLLLEKACLTYATLAENQYMEQNFGACLRAIHMSIRCQQVLVKYMPSFVSQASCLLGRAGDCFLQFAKQYKSIDLFLEQYNEMCPADENIMNELEAEVKDDENYLIAPSSSIEELMLASCKCYELALSAIHKKDEVTRTELMRRLGNVRNELGLRYMYWAQDEFCRVCKEYDDAVEKSEDKEISLSAIKKLSMKSYDSLMLGISAFRTANDKVNLAFLYCNMGRFMRFRAHLLLPEKISDTRTRIATFKRNQLKYYVEAFNYYEKAKETLVSRQCNFDLWDLFNWELSTGIFTLASQMQDIAPEDEPLPSEWEKDTLDYLQKVLKYCESEQIHESRQVLYAYRCGLIHKRLGRFQFRELKKAATPAAVKYSLQLCRLHYEKALGIFQNLHEMHDFLAVQIERISLQQFLTEASTNSFQKIKNLQVALDYCMESNVVFSHHTAALSPADDKNLVQNSNGNRGDGSTGNTSSITENRPGGGGGLSEEEFYGLMKTFEGKIQEILKTLIKTLLTISKNKATDELIDVYKKMYMEALIFGKPKSAPQAAANDNEKQRLEGPDGQDGDSKKEELQGSDVAATVPSSKLDVGITKATCASGDKNRLSLEIDAKAMQLLVLLENMKSHLCDYKASKDGKHLK